MIKIKLTENYTGFNIEGTFDDFYELYDNISYFIDYENYINSTEEHMALLIYGFLYDLRHAYQGDRDIKLIDNHLSEEDKKYFKINKSVKNDVIYSFNYVVTELLLNIPIFNYFASKKLDNKFDTNYNNVISFYSKVLDALSEILTPFQIKKIKRIFVNKLKSKYIILEYLNYQTILYLNMSKNKRKRELMHIIDKFYNYYDYDDYYIIEKEIIKYAKDNNIDVNEIKYGYYPEDIEW